MDADKLRPEFFSHIWNHEGGWHPGDARDQFPTMRGIIWPTYMVHANRLGAEQKPTKEGLKNISYDNWKKFVIHFAKTHTFDFAFKDIRINEYATELGWGGGENGNYILQKGANEVAKEKTDVDGDIGKDTVRCVNEAIDLNCDMLIDALMFHRLKDYGNYRYTTGLYKGVRMIEKNPGWYHRIWAFHKLITS